jgi:hypothetical protein
VASEVDICNLALGHIGDSATVSSINPPEGSAQAEHCSRFYPIARDALLEMHPWGFATKRINLALLTSGYPEWEYCYAMPADALNVLAVLPSDATDDYTSPATSGGIYSPQPFNVETTDGGVNVIYTDQPNAALRYSGLVTDTTKFGPLFTTSLSWLLASYLAGPVIKGDAGTAQAQRCMKMFQILYAQATVSDANQRRNTLTQSVGWIAGR